MTPVEMTAHLHNDIETRARDFLHDCANVVNEAFGDSGYPKSKYIKTIKILSDCCTQLAFRRGFTLAISVEGLTSQDIYLTLSTLGYKIYSIREEIEGPYRFCKIKFGTDLFIDGIDENDDSNVGDGEYEVESVIYYEYREDEFHDELQKLRRANGNLENDQDEEETMMKANNDH